MAKNKTGRYSGGEDQFLKDNHQTMTDKQMGDALGRDAKSVTNRRKKLNLQNPRTKPKLTKKHRTAYVAQLDDAERKKFFEKEVTASSRFRSIQQAVSSIEQKYYVEKYVEFMMDPTIETMTAMEKDTLHQMLVAEIQIQRYMQEMMDHKDLIANMVADGRIQNPQSIPTLDRSRAIKDAQDIIGKCQKSLMVERSQRLKDQSDQSVTFTNLIKELKDPRNRLRFGVEAAMLKVISEQTYNAKVGKNILSGGGRKFDMSKNFRGEIPDLPEEFLPPVEKEDDGQPVANDHSGHKGEA